MKPEYVKYSRYFTYIKPALKLPIIRTYGTTIFTIIIITVFTVFAIKPTVETILVLQKKEENFNQALEQINKKTESLTQAKENYENLDQNLKDKILSQIPDYPKFQTVIETLENTARRFEASVSALQIEPLVVETKEQGLGTLTEIGFTFNVEGVYQNLVSILQDLRRSSRLISIDRISFNKVSETGSLIMSISGKAYYLK